MIRAETTTTTESNGPIEKLRASQSNRNDARLCVGAPLKRERGTEDEKYGYRILRVFFFFLSAILLLPFTLFLAIE